MASVAAARALETGLKAGLEKTQWFFLVFFWFFWVFWIFLGFFGVFQVVFL